MKLKGVFETIELDGNTIAVPINDAGNSYHGVIKMNDTSAAIFELLQEETNEEEIVEKLLTIYEVPSSVIREDVQRLITSLDEKGLLVR